jgi:hypothetical protein
MSPSAWHSSYRGGGDAAVAGLGASVLPQSYQDLLEVVEVVADAGRPCVRRRSPLGRG